MPVLHHSDNRLRVACVCFDAAGALVDLDRTHDRAEVYRLAFVLPFGRDVTHLSEITAVQVRKQEHDDGRASYGLVLRLKHGQDIKFGCRSREAAVKTMQLVTKFLKPERA
jgi:hypothetical protein